jgi:multisubunit Na+/H+ antiporter MnhC subunit
LIWINSGSRAFREDFSIRGAIAMPIDTAVMLFAIVIPFAIFAGVLGWAQSRTK